MMGIFNFKGKKKRNFDKSTLRKNDISILILDERWNALFNSVEKSDEIRIYEKKLRELLKEEARLNTESKEILLRKKMCMDKILKLTTEVFEKNDPKAQSEMQSCEKEIKQINERLKKLEIQLENIPRMIREANLDLLESTVNLVYLGISENRNRIKELETLIEVTKKKLEEYIEEKGRLSEDSTDSYSYFHDLLGAEELEKLDRQHFGN
jgi:seryl-tRNA synthetase